tara:strand:+ start:3297 stop:4058 length:762 start_codon:yes stop_codon:yes gene_type:complete
MSTSEVKFSKIKFLFRALKYRYRNDTAEIKFILEHVRNGDSVLDIGAHKGGYLYWLRKSIGSDGLLVALEPQPTLYDYLKLAISKFRFTNIELHHAGASSEDTHLELYIPKGEGLTSPGATFEDRKDSSKGHFIKVPVHKLDELLKHRKKAINFIKLDVEGHELDVFKGALDILKQDKPTLLFECENRHLNNISVIDVFNYLTDLGFQGSFFHNNVLKPISDFDPLLHQVTQEGEIVDKNNYVNNFVFKANKD